jgi:hypothetical protein
LKRKLKDSDHKQQELRRTTLDAQSAKERLEEELATANTQLSKAERDVENMMTGSSSSSSSSSSRRGAAEKELQQVARENDQLSTELAAVKSRLNSAERELKSRPGKDAARGGAKGGTGGAGGAGGRVQELELENSKLRAELESFDLEFFEEVEDLKYKYSQAREENRRLKARMNE